MNGTGWQRPTRASSTASPRAVTAAPYASVEKADEQHRQREGDAEAELAGQRARDVAAPHRVPLVEQEKQAGRGADGRDGERIAERAQAHDGRERQQEDAEHRHQLERDVERHHPRQRDRRSGTAEGNRTGTARIRRSCRDPIPAVAGGQEDVAQVLDGMVERRRVAAGGHGVEQEQRRAGSRTGGAPTRRGGRGAVTASGRRTRRVLAGRRVVKARAGTATRPAARRPTACPARAGRGSPTSPRCARDAPAGARRGSRRPAPAAAARHRRRSS